MGNRGADYDYEHEQEHGDWSPETEDWRLKTVVRSL